MKPTNPMLSEGCPAVVAELDLTLPGLFEASAGTGKTYAIEHLVLRLLIESEDLNLQKILVLTFTEKATGELKEKIRSRLAWRLAQGGLPPAITRRLKEALLGFDRAAIYTIHGFCERVLRKYAFENHSLFQNELVKKDREVFQEVLKEEMRSTWLSEAGEGEAGLKAFTALTQALGFSNSGKWEGKLLDLAREFNTLRGDKLLPIYDAEKKASLETLMADTIPALNGLFPDLCLSQEKHHPFFKKYAAIKFKSTTLKKKGPLLVEATLKLATEFRIQDQATRLQAVLNYLEAINLKGVNNDGFIYLQPSLDEFSGGAWPELAALIEIMEKLRQASQSRDIEIQSQIFQDQRRTILNLREKTQAFKKEQGMITFNDMIEDVWKALDEKPERIEILRQDYRYCLVDEFQDTDPQQWGIFKKVFLESGSTHPLYLIGDPKQAIYRFRGGDIHTYMAARKAIFELSQLGKAQGMGLETNFRSSQKMIAACNSVFPQEPWFHALEIDPGNRLWRLPNQPDPLGYVPVNYGGLAIQEARDTTEHPTPIVLEDFALTPNLKKNAVQKNAYNWIAHEIKKLIASPEKLQIPDKVSGQYRPLELQDICILVGTRTEKSKVERACQFAGIPIQVERQAGLYGSDVAGEYLAILESLEDLRNAGKHARALLTRFFRPEGEPPAESLPENIHPFFESWSRFAERRQWQSFFQSLLYQTGVLYRSSLGADGDRRIMDYLHIGQNLVQEALNQNLGLTGLVQTLRDLRLNRGNTDEEQDFHREDSEGGKVTLMTMHVSKGLEFPVVFLASASGGRAPTYFKYREEDHTVYHLDTDNEPAKLAHKQETENEERRLFYVALTRARYKLYIPLFPVPAGRTNYGPLGGFVAQALRKAAATHGDLFSGLQVGESERPDKLWSPTDASKVFPAPLKPAAVQPQFNAEKSLSLFEGYPHEDRLNHASADFSKRRRRLSSYSHLVHHSHGLAAENIEGRFDKEEAPVSIEISEEAEGADPATSLPILFPANALPRGKDIGNMFHEILEKIDFGVVASSPDSASLLVHQPTLDLIQACMHHRRVDEEWMAGVADVIWNTLRTKIPDPAGGKAFSLSEVTDRRPEMEFLFPYPSESDESKDFGPGGYLWGFIDLVFRYQGRYYLLDWKSNYLEEYGALELSQSMQDSKYDLQYMLYSLALDKWLRSLIPDYNFDIHFGGIYYTYLRGMRALDSEDRIEIPGVFALKPTLQQMLRDFPLKIAKVMNASGASIRLDAEFILGREAGVL